MSCQLVFDNTTSSTIYLRERQYAAVEGHYGHETRLYPKAVKNNFPATLYLDRNRCSLRPSAIFIFLEKDKVESFSPITLSPQTFVQFVKIIFVLDKVNNLVVYGIPPRITDLCRLWGFGFLGRDYSGRSREIILSSSLIERNRGQSATLPPLPPAPAPAPAPAPKESTFNCSVCMGPLVEEMSTECGHIFCKACIKAAIAAQSKCPTCRRKITAKDVIRIYLPDANSA